jgi:hypothetical protein
VTQAAANSNTSNKVPAVVAAVVVVLAIGIGAMTFAGGRKDTPPAGTVATDPASPTPMVKSTTDSMAKPQPQGTAQPSTTAPVPAPTTAAKTAAAAPNVDAMLDRMSEDAKDPAKADRMLAQLEKLDLTTNEQAAKAGIVRYNAYLYGKSETGKACNAIKDVEGKASGTKLENRVNGLIEGCK